MTTLTEHDPRTLVADNDRTAAATVIARAFTEGRLTDDEHEDRAGLVEAARTRGDLDAALDGIPACVASAPIRPPTLEVVFGRLLGVLAAPAALGALVVLFAFHPTTEPGVEIKRPSHREVAADVNADWKQVDRIVSAERAVFAKTSRYTDDWTSLALSNRDLLKAETDDVRQDLVIELAEGRHGVVLHYDGAYGLALTATLDGRRRAERRCASTWRTRTGVHCPVVRGVWR